MNQRLMLKRVLTHQTMPHIDNLQLSFDSQTHEALKDDLLWSCCSQA
ncbi:CLUMA_CG011449, isoform A, partial [Clunio marinus]